MTDVARAAGVSLSTASRALNGNSELVRSELRDRVHAVAMDLGYVANAQARSLVRATTETIGLVVHDIADPYFATIAKGVIEVATEHGLFVMIASDFADPEREEEYLSSLTAQRVRAIILAGSGFEDAEVRARAGRRLDTYARVGGRVAAISEHGMAIDTVLPDNRLGARELTQHLLGHGHRSFGVITGPPELTTWRHRLSGVREALRDEGIKLGRDRVIGGVRGRDDAYAATGELLERDLALTAIIALTDLMAVGVIAALRDRGIAVPDEISVVGFDDIGLARDLTPPLTTVAVPMADLGRRATEMILAPPASKPRRTRMRTSVIERASVAAPAAAV